MHKFGQNASSPSGCRSSHTVITVDFHSKVQVAYMYKLPNTATHFIIYALFSSCIFEILDRFSSNDNIFIACFFVNFVHFCPFFFHLFLCLFVSVLSFLLSSFLSFFFLSSFLSLLMIVTLNMHKRQNIYVSTCTCSRLYRRVVSGRVKGQCDNL